MMLKTRVDLFDVYTSLCMHEQPKLGVVKEEWFLVGDEGEYEKQMIQMLSKYY